MTKFFFFWENMFWKLKISRRKVLLDFWIQNFLFYLFLQWKYRFHQKSIKQSTIYRFVPQPQNAITLSHSSFRQLQKMGPSITSNKPKINRLCNSANDRLFSLKARFFVDGIWFSFPIGFWWVHLGRLIVNCGRARRHSFWPWNFIFILRKDLLWVLHLCSWN